MYLKIYFAHWGVHGKTVKKSNLFHFLYIIVYWTDCQNDVPPSLPLSQFQVNSLPPRIKAHGVLTFGKVFFLRTVCFSSCSCCHGVFAVCVVQGSCVCSGRSSSTSICRFLPESWRSAKRSLCVTTLWWSCVIFVFDTPTLWTITSLTSLPVYETTRPSSGSRLWSCSLTCCRWVLLCPLTCRVASETIYSQ